VQAVAKVARLSDEALRKLVIELQLMLLMLPLLLLLLLLSAGCCQGGEAV
jgi:hypothetical protein